MNQVIGGIFALLIFYVAWMIIKVPFGGYGGLVEIVVPALLAIAVAVYVSEKWIGNIRFIAELSTVLAVDEMTGSLRMVGSGMQFFAPWEKVGGNEFSLETKFQDFAGDFETKDNARYRIIITIGIKADVASDETLAKFNSLGGSPIEQAFRLYGPAAGEVVQTYVSKITDHDIRNRSGDIKAELKRLIDDGNSETEKATGTQVDSIRVGVIDPDPETRANMELERRLEIQTRRAQQMVAASIGADGKPTLSFEKALEKVQIADNKSKASSVAFRGGARGFFDFDQKM